MSDSETPNPEKNNANSGETLDQQAARVLADLELLREERDKLLELARRTQADFENYQKRNLRDREEERRYALAPLARDLLPVLDNLERALAAAQDESPLRRGVELVRSQLLEALKRHGIVPIPAENRPFDPNLHEAVSQQADPNRPPGFVVRVLEAGYSYHDRVLRPAKVVVSRAE